MTSFESLHIFKLIKTSIPYNFLTIWNFLLQFSTFFKMKQYQLVLVISMHVEKQCSSPLMNTKLYINMIIHVLPCGLASLWPWNCEPWLLAVIFNSILGTRQMLMHENMFDPYIAIGYHNGAKG